MSTPQWHEEIITAAENVRFDDELKRVQEDCSRWIAIKELELRKIQDEMKADGRDRLHADEQRRENAASIQLGKVSLAVACATKRVADSKANLERVFGGDGHSNASTDWKSIFPAMQEYKAQTTGTDSAGGYLVT